MEGYEVVRLNTNRRAGGSYLPPNNEADTINWSDGLPK
ncbi:MAG: hypothetical protein [Caudoviricetes sp.]|nr:MAG: hypothetical protein [Caudoviricetes sp.]